MKTIELDDQTDRELRVLSKRRRVEARLQQRALVVLLAAKGLQNIADGGAWIAGKWRLGANAPWMAASMRFAKDAPRTGRPATITAEMESRIVHAALHDKPVNFTHWSTRTLAEHLGVGATTNRRGAECAIRHALHTKPCQNRLRTSAYEKKFGCTIWLESPQSRNWPGAFRQASTTA